MFEYEPYYPQNFDEAIRLLEDMHDDTIVKNLFPDGMRQGLQIGVDVLKHLKIKYERK